MKRVLIFLMALLVSANLFAEDVFPSFQTRVEAGNDFQIYHGINRYKNTQYLQLYHKNLDSHPAEIIAAKSKNAKMELIVRFRQFAATRDFPENFCDYYLITIDKNGNASSKKIIGIPDFEGFYCFKGTVNDNKVNFRDAPGLTGIVKGQYQDKTEIEFMGKVTGYTTIAGDPDYWYCFNYNGEERWIFGRWLTFPKLFMLDADLFTKPQVFTHEEVLTVSNTKNIKDLPFENTTEDITHVDVYKAGDSELQIIYDSKTNSTTCKIIKNNEVISTIQHPFNQKYSPITKCLYYANWDPLTLQAISIETGKAVNIADKDLGYMQEDVYLNDVSDFDLNREKDKLYYFAEEWAWDSYNEWQEFVLKILDLRTMKYNKINLRSIRDDFPDYSIYDCIMIDDNNFLFQVYNYHENKTSIFAWYQVTNGKLVLKDSIKFSGYYNDYFTFCYVGNKILLKIGGINYKDYLLSIENGSIKTEEFEGGDLLKIFVYDGVEYIATLYAEKEYADSYTVTIYEKDTLKQVQKKTFKPLNHLWGITAVGIQNGKILVEDEICK
ncbi:MAG: hypothetical protein J5747_05280 [Spirochaetaceae bacterium]|nr:hypothetical protein [Spirochaetaceae bacterium]